VHGRLFVCPRSSQTFAKSGDLVFRLDEWNEIRTLWSTVDFVEEEPMPAGNQDG
jgi:hypothetical protein